MIAVIKRLLLLVPALAALLCLSACGIGSDSQTDEGKLTVICTIFPQYDFVREIGGEYVDVSMLLPPGVESHSYEPTPQDIINIDESDLFVYVGGKSDTWVASILESFTEPPETLVMMDYVPVVTEETVEGMGGGDHDHDHEEDRYLPAAADYDEHIWTSPVNAMLICEALCDKLCDLDPHHAEAYEANTADYLKRLEDLDALFREVVDNASTDTIVFGDRFPFRYLADEYGLTYYAAFPGCSTEIEPSAATIAFLTDKIKAESIPVIFYLEFSNRCVADALAEATGVKTLLLHSCHNVSADEQASGATYISLMTENAENLKEALQ